jgi:hypothetical protein
MVKAVISRKALLVVNVVLVGLLVMYYMAHARMEYLPPDPDFSVVRRDPRYRRALIMLRLRRATSPWHKRHNKTSETYKEKALKLSSNHSWISRLRRGTRKATKACETSSEGF